MKKRRIVYCNFPGGNVPTGGSAYDRCLYTSLARQLSEGYGEKFRVTEWHPAANSGEVAGLRGVIKTLRSYFRNPGGVAEAEIMMANSSRCLYLYPVFFLRRLQGKRSVTITHLPCHRYRSGLMGRLYEIAERGLWRMADISVVPSGNTMREVERARKNKPTILVPIVRPTIGEGIKKRPIRGRLLFAGNIERRKGLHLLVEALGFLPPDILGRLHLDIVGGAIDPEYAAECESGLRALGADFEFHGYLESDKWELYSRADIFVFPSLAENYGVALAEAKYFGLPAVAFQGSGTEDVITDGVDALLVEMGDTKAYAKAIETLMADRDVWNKLGENARRGYDTLPTMEDFMGGIGKLIEEICRM